MITRHRTTLARAFTCLVALVAMSACSVSTAHLTDLKLSKDKDMTAAADTFAPTDTIYATSGIANNPSKATLVWHITAVNAKGQPPNTKIAQLDKSFDLDADGTSSYSLTPPTAGWPVGSYQIEVDMMIDGVQKEQKTATFTVAS
jgi:hypothetical protein